MTRGDAPRLDADDAAALERCVLADGVAVFPTDTVYGVCCSPESETAARRLYELKGRPPERPSAVMFFALDAAMRRLEVGLKGTERSALEALLPGPVTLLVPNRTGSFLEACGPDPATIGLRVPLLPQTLSALDSVRAPLMQSSANLSGGADARSLAQVPAELLEGVDLVLDGGELPGISSTVIDLREYDSHGRWRVIREGALPLAGVEQLIGPSVQPW
jgi:L-threonylcarbamoyladenylate synthase